MRPAVSEHRGCRYWRNLLVVAVAGFLVAILGLAYGALPAVSARAVAHPGRSSACCSTPADRGLAYEEASFASADGLVLYGWYLPSQNGAAVIIVPGIGGNRQSYLDQGVALARRGYGVLLLEPRAHGESQGEAITFGGDDVLGATAYLEGRPDVAAQRIGAWGFSLGGLAILQAAARTEAIHAVVADGPSPGTLRDLPPPQNLSEWLWIPFHWSWFQFLKHQGVSAPIPVVEALPQIAPRPILLIAGAAQESERHRLKGYYAAAAEPKTLWEIPEAGHLGGWQARPKEYEARVVAFFDGALLASR